MDSKLFCAKACPDRKGCDRSEATCKRNIENRFGLIKEATK